MVKRIVIGGSRHYENYDEAKEYLNACLKGIKDGDTIVILSGGARGADAIAERYAKENGYELEVFPAEWKRYRKRAGPLRNKAMVETADLVICFWDRESKGTRSLINIAKQLKKELTVMEIK